MIMVVRVVYPILAVLGGLVIWDALRERRLSVRIKAVRAVGRVTCLRCGIAHGSLRSFTRPQRWPGCVCPNSIGYGA